MSDTLTPALGYVKRGWRVIWAPQGGKFPTVKEWQHKATTSVPMVIDWFDENPELNVCIATGRESNLWVLDVDDKPGKVGTATLERLEREHGPLPDTYTVGTGSGGMHFYYTWEGVDFELGNSAGRLGRDLDTRGIGGQVVAPPSRAHDPSHFQAYQVLIDMEPVAAPAWLIDMLRPKTVTQTQPSAVEIKPDIRPGENTPYGDAALDGICTDIANAPLGQGDHTVYTKSLYAGQLIAGGELSNEAAVIQHLQHAVSSWTRWDQPGDHERMLRKVEDCVRAGQLRTPKQVTEQDPFRQIRHIAPTSAPTVATRPGPAVTASKEGTDEDRERPARVPVLLSAADVREARVRWLWRDRAPMGELTLIAGKGGVGKSTLLCTQAAWITKGLMKGEFWGEPRDVIYVVNEDSKEYTVKPRLYAAGADLSRVHFLTVDFAGEADSVVLPRDCDMIAEVADRLGAPCIMFDPLSSNLRVDANAQKEVRPAMEAVRRMCEQANVAGLGLAHVRKAMSTNLLDAMMGSVELGNVCRSVMGVIADPDEEGVVLVSQEKNNLGRLDLPSFRYRIETYSYLAGIETITTGRLKWEEETDRKVSDILAEGMSAAGSPSSVKEACQWLEEYLAVEGLVPRTAVLNAGKREGYQEHTLKRAAARVKASVSRVGFPATTLWGPPSPVRTVGTTNVLTVPTGSENT